MKAARFTFCFSIFNHACRRGIPTVHACQSFTSFNLKNSSRFSILHAEWLKNKFCFYHSARCRVGKQNLFSAFRSVQTPKTKFVLALRSVQNPKTDLVFTLRSMQNPKTDFVFLLCSVQNLKTDFVFLLCSVQSCHSEFVFIPRK